MFFFVLTRRGPRKTQKGVKHFYLITRAFVLGFKLLPRHARKNARLYPGFYRRKYKLLYEREKGY